MKIISFLLTTLTLVSLIPMPCLAEEPESYLTPHEEPENYDLEEVLIPYESDFFSFLDAPHELISGGVESMAQEMDLFFADEKIYSETTNSYARLSSQINFSHGGETSTTEDIKLKVDLKKTKKKLKLLLESDTDRDLQTGTDQSTAPGQAQEEVSFFAALQKEVSRKRKWSTKASLGIKLKVPLDPFLLLRANKNSKYGDWKMRFSETIFWFNSRGGGASSLLEFDYALTEKLLFRSTTSELWTDFLDYHEASQSFSLFQELSDRRAVSYSIGTTGISEPVWHNTAHYISLNYRQRIHRDWLYLDLNPIITYARDNDYKDQRSITLRLEMVFGNKYVYRPRTEEDDY
ncbi:MAG: hypothetical protein OEY52_10715 [Gammaproteobacteria bacterium]|nr:hypothetical protein [Gammaproteobacteria bacterium]